MTVSRSRISSSLSGDNKIVGNGNMFPEFPSHNSANGKWLNSIVGCYRYVSLAFNHTLEYIKDRLGVQFANRKRVPKRVPSFIHHVLDVIKSSANKQMCGIHASPVVAPMKDAQVFGYGSVGNLPRNPMSDFGFLFPTRIPCQVSVPAMVKVSGPDPTALTLAHELPKGGYVFHAGYTKV